MNKATAVFASKPVSELHVEDLQKIIRDTFAELIREIVRQEQRPSYYLDDSGYKIFFQRVQLQSLRRKPSRQAAK